MLTSAPEASDCRSRSTTMSAAKPFPMLPGSSRTPASTRTRPRSSSRRIDINAEGSTFGELAYAGSQAPFVKAEADTIERTRSIVDGSTITGRPSDRLITEMSLISSNRVQHRSRWAIRRSAMSSRSVTDSSWSTATTTTASHPMARKVRSTTFDMGPSARLTG